jgi:LemA protein
MFESMAVFVIGVFFVVFFILAPVLWVISTYNRFKVLLVKISEADSGIDVALTKRYDTLTKLIDVVKAYAKHESVLFEKVVMLRGNMSMAEKTEASRVMDDAAKKLRFVAEDYPELRSSENYKQLQDAIVDAEDHLQAARRLYNMNVSSFNQAIAMLPASIIANFAKHTPREFFATDEVRRGDVDMKGLL